LQLHLKPDVFEGQLSSKQLTFILGKFTHGKCPLMADCRPPSKASSFATSDHGRAWYATRKLTLVNATTEVRRSAIGAGLVMA